MKNLCFAVILISLCLASCSKDNKGIRRDSKILIQGVASDTKTHADSGTPIRGTDITDSVEFAVKYVIAIDFLSLDGESKKQSTTFGLTEELYNRFRDITNNRLIYQGVQVVSSIGTLGSFVTDCKEAVLIAYNDRDGNIIHPLQFEGHPDFGQYCDTIGYIPKAVLTRARNEITAAFDREDYDECYRLFNELFIFKPTTGEKWRALKAAGIE